MYQQFLEVAQLFPIEENHGVLGFEAQQFIANVDVFIASPTLAVLTLLEGDSPIVYFECASCLACSCTSHSFAACNLLGF